MIEIILLSVILLGGINLIRIAILLISTDVHEYRQHKLSLEIAKSSQARIRRPYLSILVPAYNEELSIKSSIASICKSTYRNYEVIVIDDGSHDKTSKLVQDYISENPKHKVTLIRQTNAGKAHALNNGIGMARGSLVMCLDADSLLAPDAIEKTVAHFNNNPKLVAMASNVHVTSTGSLLGMVQKFEYLLSYRLKRALNVLQSEYIIGGVGSTFRKSVIKKVGLYDTDTMTEDIDLTMKIVGLGNKKYQLGYGYDVHTYTQGVLNIRDLVKQRFRWKYGRMQTFIKNRRLFFNRDKKYSKTLTMYQLPYAVIGEVALLAEPIFILFIFTNALLYKDLFSLFWIMGFMTFYMGAIILNDTLVPLRERLKLMAHTPIIWFLFYLIVFVEFSALIKCLLRLPTIRKSMASASASRWEHVKRAA